MGGKGGRKGDRVKGIPKQHPCYTCGLLLPVNYPMPSFCPHCHHHNWPKLGR